MMDIGKLSSQPPVIAAFCLCSIFILMHVLAAPSEPRGFAQGVYVPPAASYSPPAASFLAVANGMAVKSRKEEIQVAKQSVKSEQKLEKAEKKNEKKAKTHIKDEEKNLKKEMLLLEREKSAMAIGDINAESKFEKQLDKLAKSEHRDASIADKVVVTEKLQETQLASLFQNWASSVKHPGSKWGKKHAKDVSKQAKLGKNLASLTERQSRVEKGQARFVEERQAVQARWMDDLSHPGFHH